MENKDVELYQRIAVLEEQFKASIPRIDEKLENIEDILDNGLKEDVKQLKEDFQTHVSLSKAEIERKSKLNYFWLYGIRAIMIAGGIALIGMFLEKLFGG